MYDLVLWKGSWTLYCWTQHWSGMYTFSVLCFTGVLGEPQPHTRHAARQRYWDTVQVWHLHVRWRAAAGSWGVSWCIPRTVEQERPWHHHHRDLAGARVLLCRRLPPAVPGQEPWRILRAGGHRGHLPYWTSQEEERWAVGSTKSKYTPRPKVCVRVEL